MRRHRRGGDNRPPNFPFELNRSSPQARGLVGWWPTHGSRGTNVLRDFSLNKNDGVFVGTPDWVIDPDYGWVIDLELGSTELVNLGAIPVLNQISGQITMSCWAWAESISGSAHEYMMGSGYNGTNEGWHLKSHFADRITAGSYDGTDYRAEWIYGAEWGTEQLANIIGLYDGANWKIYFNGIEKATAAKATGALTCSTRAALGAFDNNGTWQRHWDGKLFDCRIYNRGLSPAEVWQLFDPSTRYDLYLPVRRVWPVVSVAPPADAMPMAMDTYRRRRVAV